MVSNAKIVEKAESRLRELSGHDGFHSGRLVEWWYDRESQSQGFMVFGRDPDTPLMDVEATYAREWSYIRLRLGGLRLEEVFAFKRGEDFCLILKSIHPPELAEPAGPDGPTCTPRGALQVMLQLRDLNKVVWQAWTRWSKPPLVREAG